MPDCLRIRLRPTGPWRIAPDSGERDRVGRVFHSDTLYSAVCSAMLRLGELDEWIADTARNADGPPVRFSSLFPYLRDLLFLPTPRGLWPPPPSSKLYTHAVRFLPQSVASALFEGKPLQEDRWEVDGASECLLPASSRGPATGPFRLAMRSGIAVDRLEPGKSELHRTACLEFAHNAGWWFLVQFADDGARARWEARVMAAIRLLADSGFGGRRSIGWGHAEIADVTSGPLAELVLGRRAKEKPPAPAVSEEIPVAAPPEAETPAVEAAPEIETPAPPDAEVPREETSPAPAEADGASEETAAVEAMQETEPAGVESPLADQETAAPEEASPGEETPSSSETFSTGKTPAPEAAPSTDAEPETPADEASVKASGVVGLAAPPAEPAPTPTAWWLLSLFTPGPGDSIDWDRGAYALLAREGRIESPERWGDRKKISRMVVEGSLLLSADAPAGAAVDVAPEGFPHPVFRAGFAVALPVPYRSGA